jgi:hypothetical protein
VALPQQRIFGPERALFARYETRFGAPEFDLESTVTEDENGIATI